MKQALRFALMGLLALVLTALVTVFLIIRFVLAPGAGEWSAPLALGPLRFDVGVPTVLRLATASWFAPHLDGRTFDTRFGPVRLGWDGATSTFEMQCAPCSAALPAFTQPVRADRLQITLQRDNDNLHGGFEIIPAGAAASAPLRGKWDGRITQKALHLNIDAAEAPVTQWLTLFAPALPELQRAHIGGTLAWRAQWAPPTAGLLLHPRLNQFTVQGLGVQEQLAAQPACGAPSQLGLNNWLSRAVIAAQDPRFTQHPGYNLNDVVTVLSGGAAAQPTLTQGLVAAFVTGTDGTNGTPAERQLRALLYAAELEQTLGKEGILRYHLDHLPWGLGACGAEVAARRYFRTGARTLSPAQAVWLAALQPEPDAALAQWRRDGRLDAARLKAIAEAMRGVTRGERETLQRSLANARFAAPS